MSSEEIQSVGEQDLDKIDDIEDEQEEEDDDDEEEDDVEPRLVYDRLKAEITTIVQSDAISCVAVHDKFLIVGTHCGKICVLDHQGNKVHGDITLPTSTSVTMMSIDVRGEYIASSSGNKVFVHGLLDNDHNVLIPFDRPVKGVGIDPQFSKNSDRRIVTADADRITIHGRNFINKYVKNVISFGDGVIRNVKWTGNFIAWATDGNLRIYDVGQKTLIAVIKKDHDGSLRPEIYRCMISFKTDRTLLIGWGDSVKVCEIRDRASALSSPSHASSLSSDQPDKYVEVTSMFTIPSCVAGIAPLEDKIILLCLEKETTGEMATSEDNNGSPQPQVVVIQPLEFDYTELSNEGISVKGYQVYHCSDYHFEAVPEDGVYFIICPKDIILTKQREADDHISWLLERNRFSDALEFISSHGYKVRKYTYSQVGQQYLDYLIDMGRDEDIEEAARLCPSICIENTRLWEQVFKTFDAIDKLACLAPHLPVKEGFTLNQEVYESVLKSFMKRDSRQFLHFLSKWPRSLYRSKVVIHDCMEVLQFDVKNDELLKGLGMIYTNEGRHDKALEIYLQIGDHDQVFALISRFDLYATLKERLIFLMQLNPGEASRLLLDNQNKIPVDHVVSQLSKKPELLWVYLDMLMRKDSENYPEHHQRLVELYAKYCPSKLLPFLKMSNHYSLEKALAICQENNLVSEMVFLLARMGKTKEALRYIVHSLNDIHMAIDFCREQEDPELWDNLIDMSMKNPEFIRELLSNIGTNIPDPVGLINRIPEGVKIPGLKEALIQVLDDFRLQISLEERSRRVLTSDNFNLLDRLISMRKRPHVVNQSTTCTGCGRAVIIGGGGDVHLVLFNCKHVFHEDCLPVREDNEKPSCTLCTPVEGRGKHVVRLFRS